MSSTAPNLKICERCYSNIEDGEAFVALAHIAGVGPDGVPEWRSAYLHAVGGSSGYAAASPQLCLVAAHPHR
ncbi:hypothetical protein [Pseudonocardia sp. GCM10023141]|uniref:hypothetical protein n=1 Tax=Pseudonocardia sp. GCM10023141 TaxID=3252653 RepID=UPI003607B0E3